MVIMVTIRAHQVKRHVTVQQLDRVCLHLSQENLVLLYDYADELGPRYKQLHRHGLAVSPPNINRFHLPTSILGFRIYYRNVVTGSEGRCHSYIHKNADECHIVINDYQSYAFA